MTDMKDKTPRRKPEIRTTACKLAVREKKREDGSAEESRTITGTAIVFDEPFDVTDWRGDIYRESIAPSAATMEFLKTQDIKMNLLHRRDTTLARWNRGEGNMRLSVDQEGVHFEFEAPRCDLGDRALELVRAGVYSGCSFEFYSKDYEVKEDENAADGTKITTIRHTAFESVEALTIAMDPAYEQTSVSVGELREKTAHPQGSDADRRERGIVEAQAEARRRQIRNNETFFL